MAGGRPNYASDFTTGHNDACDHIAPKGAIPSKSVDYRSPILAALGESEAHGRSYLHEFTPRGKTLPKDGGGDNFYISFTYRSEGTEIELEFAVDHCPVCSKAYSKTENNFALHFVYALAQEAGFTEAESRRHARLCAAKARGKEILDLSDPCPICNSPFYLAALNCPHREFHDDRFITSPVQAKPAAQRTADGNDGEASEIQAIAGTSGNGRNGDSALAAEASQRPSEPGGRAECPEAVPAAPGGSCELAHGSRKAGQAANSGATHVRTDNRTADEAQGDVLGCNFTDPDVAGTQDHRPGIVLVDSSCKHDQADGWAARFIEPEFLAITSEESPVVGRVSRYHFNALESVDATADFFVDAFGHCNFTFLAAAHFNTSKNTVLRSNREKAARLRASRARRSNRRPLNNCNSAVRAYAPVSSDATGASAGSRIGISSRAYDGRVNTGNSGNDLRPSEVEGGQG